MGLLVANGSIDNVNSSSSHTLSVGFQPKAGFFWFQAVNSSDVNEDDNFFSIGFWTYENNSSTYQCHAFWRAEGSSATSYAAVFTDCVAAYINTATRQQYINVTNVSSSGITIGINPTRTNAFKHRLYWVLFGGNVQAYCGGVSIPNNTTWSPITVTGHGFDVSFSVLTPTQSTTPSTILFSAFTVAHHDKAAGVYRYSTHGIAQGTGNNVHDVSSGSAVKVYRHGSTSNYISVKNTNSNTDLYITREYTDLPNASTFSYLSLRNVSASSDGFVMNNSSTSEESKSYTFPNSPVFFMALASCWGSNTSTKLIPCAISSIVYSSSSGSQAFSITKYPGLAIYDYSSSDKCFITHNTNYYNISQSYWKFVSYNSSTNTWNYGLKAPLSSTYVPMFILGLSDPVFVLSVTSNSRKDLECEAQSESDVQRIQQFECSTFRRHTVQTDPHGSFEWTGFTRKETVLFVIQFVRAGQYIATTSVPRTSHE
jgi:hypothetical protein